MVMVKVIVIRITNSARSLRVRVRLIDFIILSLFENNVNIVLVGIMITIVNLWQRQRKG